jgi:hypothetical protein
MCMSAAAPQDASFWARPLADTSKCFTETLACREAHAGLRRWWKFSKCSFAPQSRPCPMTDFSECFYREPSLPLVLLTARAAQADAISATAATVHAILAGKEPAATGSHCEKPVNFKSVIFEMTIALTREFRPGRSMAAWHYVLLTDSPSAVRHAWEQAGGGALVAGNVEFVLVDTETLVVYVRVCV